MPSSSSLVNPPLFDVRMYCNKQFHFSNSVFFVRIILSTRSQNCTLATLSIFLISRLIYVIIARMQSHIDGLHVVPLHDVRKRHFVEPHKHAQHYAITQRIIVHLC